MRAALICLSGEREAAATCQLELALACSCELVIVHGHGASPLAIALRHRAEGAGARFLTVNDTRALIGAIGAQDSLLVLQAGLWVEALLEPLQSNAGVLVLPAGVGVQRGFERIDLDRAWAGALVLPGHLLAGLGALPHDAAPAPALLRIALQHRLAETRLPVEMLDNGAWHLLRSEEAASEHGHARLVRKLGDGGGPSGWIARKSLLLADGALAKAERGFAAILAGTGAALAGAVAAALLARPVVALASLALAALLSAMTERLASVRTAPFAKSGNWALLRHVLDAALLACAILAIEGLWQRSLFAPLVLLTGLLLLDRRGAVRGLEIMRDRGVVALAIAFMMLVLRPESAIMAAAAVVLAANLAPQRG